MGKRGQDEDTAKETRPPVQVWAESVSKAGVGAARDGRVAQDEQRASDRTQDQESDREHESDREGEHEQRTVIAQSPSASMLPAFLADSDLNNKPTARPPPLHPADDEPETMARRELATLPAPPDDSVARLSDDSVPRLSDDSVARLSDDSVPRLSDSARMRLPLPTPRMDLRIFTPSSMAPSAITIAPPKPSSSSSSPSTSTSRTRSTPSPFAPIAEPSARQPRAHPIAWVGLGVILGAGVMAAILLSRGAPRNSAAPTNAAPANASVPAETDLDRVAPMPPAR